MSSTKKSYTPAYEITILNTKWLSSPWLNVLQRALSPEVGKTKRSPPLSDQNVDQMRLLTSWKLPPGHASPDELSYVGSNKQFHCESLLGSVAQHIFMTSSKKLKTLTALRFVSNQVVDVGVLLMGEFLGMWGGRDQIFPPDSVFPG